MALKRQILSSSSRTSDVPGDSDGFAPMAPCLPLPPYSSSFATQGLKGSYGKARKQPDRSQALLLQTAAPRSLRAALLSRRRGFCSRGRPCRIPIPTQQLGASPVIVEFLLGTWIDGRRFEANTSYSALLASKQTRSIAWEVKESARSFRSQFERRGRSWKGLPLEACLSSAVQTLSKGSGRHRVVAMLPRGCNNK
eukprot:scaffold3668_cov185-Pinguiococcus_pyrenoidosus.AAC.2